jgi:hypothetical protein
MIWTLIFTTKERSSPSVWNLLLPLVLVIDSEMSPVAMVITVSSPFDPVMITTWSPAGLKFDPALMIQ